MDYKLGGIVSACLSNKESATSARKLSKKLAKALTAYDVTSRSYQNLLESLARNQPLIFLDEFIDNEEIDYARIFLYNNDHDERNPLSKIEDDKIISWCQTDPSKRYPQVAASIAAYRLSEIETKLEWTPLALNIIDKAPDIFAVLNGFKRSFRPMIWNGYRSDVLQERLPLLIDLKEHEDPLVRDWAYDEERRFVIEINAERLQEEERNQSRDERFEY